MFILQMTGLSGAGKTTLATALKEQLNAKGISATVIDADIYRKTLCRDLGFSAADRRENIRRLAAIAHSYQLKGVLAIIAAINPYEEIRIELRERFAAKIIWLRCALDQLVHRDTKGLYKRALLPDDHPEKIWNLTGINDPYEFPLHPDLVMDTDVADVASSTQKLMGYVLSLWDDNPIRS